jgi:hypothetical protein
MRRAKAALFQWVQAPPGAIHNRMLVKIIPHRWRRLFALRYLATDLAQVGEAV